MENFTPVAALVGGVLIGLGAVALMAFSGRIAGIAGIAGGLFAASGGDTAWRIAFVVGLIAGPGAVLVLGGTRPPVQIDASLAMVVAGGLLVGFGSRLGNGCTSGHGVCGLARLSPRSAVATLTFMAAAIAVVVIVRHVIGG